MFNINHVKDYSTNTFVYPKKKKIQIPLFYKTITLFYKGHYTVGLAKTGPGREDLNMVSSGFNQKINPSLIYLFNNARIPLTKNIN